jgi:hypothetical protein
MKPMGCGKTATQSKKSILEGKLPRLARMLTMKAY